jgi:hypothetical protein
MRKENEQQVLALKHHLSSLKERITKTTQEEASTFAQQMMLQSQMGYCESLEEEIHTLESDEDFLLAIKGNKVQNHMVSATLLSTLLSHMRNISNSIVKGIKNRSFTDDSLGEIDPNQQLLVSAFAPSSFAIKFRFSERESLDEGLTAIIKSMGALFLPDISKEELIKLLVEFKLRTRYQHLLEFVTDQKIDLEMKSSYLDQNTIHFTKEIADSRKTWISVTREHEEVLGVTGFFYGGDLKRGKFFVESDEGIPYRGDITVEALEQIKNIPLGSCVVAQIKETVENKTAAVKENLTFILQDIIRCTEEEVVDQ